MEIVDQKPTPEGYGARAVYRVRQLLAFPFSFVAFVVAGLTFLAGALLVLAVAIAVLAVWFVCFVLWNIALALSPHGINKDALE